MIYVIVIRAASARGDAYARAGAGPDAAQLTLTGIRRTA